MRERERERVIEGKKQREGKSERGKEREMERLPIPAEIMQNILQRNLHSCLSLKKAGLADGPYKNQLFPANIIEKL